MVNLDEVDRMIKSGFDGVEAACAGVDDHLTIFLTDEDLAEEVKAYVVDKTGLPCSNGFEVSEPRRALRVCESFSVNEIS